MNRVIALSLFTLIGSGCAGQIDPEDDLEQTEAGLTSQPIDRVTSLNRAETWLHPKIVYSNNAGSAPGGYRADCSGFVSMTWNIAPPGLTTATLGSVSQVIAKDDLTMGDVMLWRNTSGGMGHVVLFERWVDRAHTHYWAYEQAGDPYNGTAHRIVAYPYDNGGGPYIPHRYNQMRDAVIGAILAHYNALGGSASFLGRATSGELGAPDGVGRYNYFQGGAIYFTPALDAHELHGDIFGKWTDLRREQGILGYPITDETGTPDGVGRFNHFQWGSIYWTPSTGAHALHGSIGGKWAQMGFERSALGYPISDEHDVPNGRQSDFQHGSLFWDRATQVVSVTTN
jgi:hypothetical protein